MEKVEEGEESSWYQPLLDQIDNIWCIERQINWKYIPPKIIHKKNWRRCNSKWVYKVYNESKKIKTFGIQVYSWDYIIKQWMDDGSIYIFNRECKFNKKVLMFDTSCGMEVDDEPCGMQMNEFEKKICEIMKNLNLKATTHKHLVFTYINTDDNINGILQSIGQHVDISKSFVPACIKVLTLSHGPMCFSIYLNDIIDVLWKYTTIVINPDEWASYVDYSMTINKDNDNMIITSINSDSNGNNAKTHGNLDGNITKTHGHLDGNNAKTHGNLDGNIAKTHGHLDGNNAKTHGYSTANNVDTFEDSYEWLTGFAIKYMVSITPKKITIYEIYKMCKYPEIMVFNVNTNSFEIIEMDLQTLTKNLWFVLNKYTYGMWLNKYERDPIPEIESYLSNKYVRKTINKNDTLRTSRVYLEDMEHLLQILTQTYSNFVINILKRPRVYGKWLGNNKSYGSYQVLLILLSFNLVKKLILKDNCITNDVVFHALCYVKFKKDRKKWLQTLGALGKVCEIYNSKKMNKEKCYHCGAATKPDTWTKLVKCPDSKCQKIICTTHGCDHLSSIPGQFEPPKLQFLTKFHIP